MAQHRLGPAGPLYNMFCLARSAEPVTAVTARSKQNIMTLIQLVELYNTHSHNMWVYATFFYLYKGFPFKESCIHHLVLVFTLIY
jgi:hypothetical protein